jgi:riboflavin kinase/FMN adenylyltransferase
MRIFHDIENASLQRPTVLTLGVFDGLHLGHQAIMKKTVERAKSLSLVSTAITFDPHPRSILHPDAAPPLLQTLDQRLANFEFLGIQQAIVIRFDKEFASTQAEDFIREVIVSRLHAREVYIGKDFAFGSGRKGNIELLKTLGNELGFNAEAIGDVMLRGRRVSSSEIRKLLSDGKVNIVRAMLGRPYGIEGVIVQGSNRGHQLGFPTANLHPHNRVIPKFGVYVTTTLIDGRWYNSITNVGIRPTFETDSEPSIETFIFDFDGNLYGDVIRVRFLHRIRNEKRFENIEQLKQQIQRDVKAAVDFFKRKPVKKLMDSLQPRVRWAV